MEYVGWLAPIAFVFAIGAYAQAGALRKEVAEIKKELTAIKTKG